MGAWQEIVDYTWAANETSRAFTGFGTITKDDFIKIVFTAINGTNNGVSINLLANASVATNYHRQWIQANATSVAASRPNDAMFANIFDSGTSTTIGYLKLSENDRTNVFSNTNYSNSTNTLVMYNYVTSSGATFTSGITSLTLTSSAASGIGTGSRIQIYKLVATKVADITVASNTTQVDISNLSIDKDSEYLLVADVNSTAFDDIMLFVNDNTTQSNYYSQVIRATGTIAAANRYNRPSIGYNINGTRNITYVHIKLSQIGAFTYQAYNNHEVSPTIRVENYFGSSTAENITSITKLNLVSLTANAIGATSKFTLYKLY